MLDTDAMSWLWIFTQLKKVQLFSGSLFMSPGCGRRAVCEGGPERVRGAQQTPPSQGGEARGRGLATGRRGRARGLGSRSPAPRRPAPHLQDEVVAAGPADDAVRLLALLAALARDGHQPEALGDRQVRVAPGSRRGAGPPQLLAGTHGVAGAGAGHVAAGHMVELRGAVRGVGADAGLALGGVHWGAGLGTGRGA